MDDELQEAPYYNVVDQIYHAPWVYSKLRQQQLLAECVARLWPSGHPTRCVQVAGTSGKGSVCRYLEAGFSLIAPAGSLTGPHLFDYRERFSIQGLHPSRADIVEAWEQVVLPLALRLAQQGDAYTLTTMDVTILIALVLFEKHGVKVAAMETGIGGRYDTITALKVDAVALTNVGHDHEELLGAMEWQRALDKAGVCREAIPFFTSVRSEESLKVVRAICRHKHAPLTVVGEGEVMKIRDVKLALTPQDSGEILLRGEHQLWNAALAKRVVQAMFPQMSDNRLVEAFSQVRFEGRFERLGDHTIVDIAHNPDKIAALVRQLKEHASRGKAIFVIGLSGKRSAAQVFAPIFEVASRIIVTGAGYKGIEPEVVATGLRDMQIPNVPIEVVPDPQAAMKRAETLRGNGGTIVLTGSTYMIDQCLNPDPYLRLLNGTIGWRLQPPG